MDPGDARAEDNEDVKWVGSVEVDIVCIMEALVRGECLVLGCLVRGGAGEKGVAVVVVLDVARRLREVLCAKCSLVDTSCA